MINDTLEKKVSEEIESVKFVTKGKNRLTWTFPNKDTSSCLELIKKLEKYKEDKTINYEIKNASLEDVYLK